MNEDHRQSEEGGNGVQSLDNVVRLPWLDSREELVPIGKPVDAEARADVPPAANDFWSEASADVQSALRAPARSDDWLEPREQAAFQAEPSQEPSPPAWRPRARRTRLPTPRRTAAVVVGLIVGLAFVVLIVSHGSSGQLGASTPRPSASAPGAAPQPDPITSVAASTEAFARHLERTARRTEVSLRTRPRHAVGRHHRAPRHHAHPVARTSPHRTFVSSPPAAATTPAASQGSTSSSSGSTPSASSASQSHASRHTGSSAPAGPTGPTALIGAGTSPSG